jgi:serine protease Do
LRDGKERTTDVKLTTRTDELASGESESSEGGDESGASTALVGVHVAALPAELAQRLKVPRGEGLIVTSVDEGSAAEAAGVQANDVLLELQRKPMSSIDAFQRASQAVKPGDTVLFRVKRGGSALYLAARAPVPKK